MLYTRLKETFSTVFGKEGALYTTPGSLVVLGEQADELKGYALAGAVDRMTAVVVRENGTDVARIFYMDTNELDEVSPSIQPTKPWSWSLYGVMTLMHRHGLPINGFDAVVGGLLPNQACFSGYSALTTLGCLVLNDISHLGLSRFDMVKLAHEAENQTSGQPVSIIHPFVSLFGQADSLIRVNSHTLEYEYLKWPTSNACLLLLDVMRPSGSFLTDRARMMGLCAAAYPILQRRYPGLTRLADLTVEQLDAVGEALPADVIIACRYALHENIASQKASEALGAMDMNGLGAAINEAQAALLDFQCDPGKNCCFCWQRPGNQRSWVQGPSAWEEWVVP